MKLYIFFVLCMLAFLLPQDTVGYPESNSAKGSPVSTQETRSWPSHSTVSKSKEKVPMGHPTIRSKSSASSTMKTTSQQNPKSPIPQRAFPTSAGSPKSSSPVPTTTSASKSTTSPKSSSPVPTTTSALKSTTSPKSSSPVPTTTSALKSTTIPKSSSPTTTINLNSTTSQSSITPKLTSASPTLTVSNGQTASAQVGWIVVGVGVGGAVAVDGNILPVAGGTAGIIVENGPGQDKIESIDTTTTSTTTTSTTTTSTTSKESSSSSSPTASPTPYNIYPKFDSTSSQQSAFARELERIAQPGSARSIIGARDKLLLWVASLTPAQASELSRDPVVRGLNVDPSLRTNLERGRASGKSPPPNCPPETCSHQKRDGTILMQSDAYDDLMVISQASGAALEDLFGYAYDSRGGQGITVYVVDSGIDPAHEEFSDMQGRIRWLFLPNEPQNESDEGGHGTCVTSKVSSTTFGVAKNANIVVVKVHPIDYYIAVSRYIEACAVVARDIESKGLQGKAVICSTLNAPPYELTDNDMIAFKAGVEDLIGLDAVFVTASGNKNDDLPGDQLATYPPLLGNQLPIVIVGAVDVDGIPAEYNQGTAAELTVSAPGLVFCAANDGGTYEWGGTSFAAPAVAGLAAYFMSLDQYRQQLQVPGSVARNVRDLIVSLAYARSPLQPVVAWNGIDSRQIQCPVRRDSGSSGCPVRNTTLPIVSSTQFSISTQDPKLTPSSSSSFYTIIVSSSISTITIETASSTASTFVRTDSSTLTTLTLSLGGSSALVRIFATSN